MRLGDFAGDWRVARSIDDRRQVRAGRFDGTAVFAPIGGGLAYHETGLLSFPGAAPMQATRRFLWRGGDDGGIDVLFEDGRFFHRFDSGLSRPEAVHLCGDDRYDVRYDFGNWPAWRCEWRGGGPRKDFRLASEYRPAGQGSESAR